MNVRTSDDFARALANKIRLAIDDDFMAALQIQTFELQLDLFDSQEQFNRMVYATHDQIWEAKETRTIDKINLQNDVMQADHMNIMSTATHPPSIQILCHIATIAPRFSVCLQSKIQK